MTFQFPIATEHDDIIDVDERGTADSTSSDSVVTDTGAEFDDESLDDETKEALAALDNQADADLVQDDEGKVKDIESKPTNIFRRLFHLSSSSEKEDTSGGEEVHTPPSVRRRARVRTTSSRSPPRSTPKRGRPRERATTRIAPRSPSSSLSSTNLVGDSITSFMFELFVPLLVKTAVVTMVCTILWSNLYFFLRPLPFCAVKESTTNANSDVRLWDIFDPRMSPC